MPLCSGSCSLEHMARKLYSLAQWCVRYRRLVIVGWLLVLIVAIGASSAFGGKKSTDFAIPGTESQAANDLLTDRFPSQAGSSAQIVFASKSPGGLTSSDGAAAVKATMALVAKAPEVIAAGDPLEPQTISQEGTVAFTEVRYAVAADKVTDAAVVALKKAAEPARAAGIQVELRGDVITAHSSAGESGGSHLGEIIGLCVAVVVLLVAFGSVLAALTPIVSGLIGVGITVMVLNLAANLFSINQFGPTLAIMIGLAVGIDYALFIVSRHRQNLRSGMEMTESIARATATAGSAVLFAGITVVIAISGLAVVGIPLLTSIGVSAAIAVVIAVAVALTLLPAVLGGMGAKIDAFTLPGMKAKVEVDDDAHQSMSARWARRVTQRPGRWLVVGVVAMGLLAAPALSMRLGNPDDGVLGSAKTERRAYDLLTNGFGPGFNGPYTVVVDLGGVPSEQRGAVLERVTSDVGQVQGVAFVSPAFANETGDTAVITAIPTTGPSAKATEDTLHRVRDANRPIEQATGADLFVTGSAAVNIDMSERLTDALPKFIAIVIGLTFVLLLIVFRSVLVPIKAAIAILVSIVAALGMVVAVFQWGWGASVIGVPETMPLIAFLPVLMFAILFGLSMDYEVFILSRIREEHSKGLSNTDAVHHGISATAQIITAAALIMISVFSAFIVNPDPTIKMFGVGLAVAVLLDATIVRMIMVPATMVLMREGNWWLPKWLDRIIPNVDIEGASLDKPHQPNTDRSSAGRDRVAAQR
jgi:putative drug exporter of the RND superfamily